MIYITMKLRILNDDVDPSKVVQNGGAAKGAKFDNYLINNNPITADIREYYLEVDGIPASFPGHKDHKDWIAFLTDNPHMISNFDTRDHGKLSFLFDRWKLTKFR